MSKMINKTISYMPGNEGIEKTVGVWFMRWDKTTNMNMMPG